MERTKGLKRGLKAATTAVFLAAALLSTGCGQNALVNPLTDQAQGQSVVNTAGQELKPAGHELKPAGHEVKP
jgi:hypothetical protein